jgi:hypothetical protein
MVAAGEVSQRFVKELLLDVSHLPNFEPVYFEELRIANIDLYIDLERYVRTPDGEPIYDWDDIVLRQIYRLLMMPVVE